MKKVMVGVGLGLATISQAHAWNPISQSVQQATGVTESFSQTVTQSNSVGTNHCRLPANRAHGQSYQCTGSSGQVIQQVQPQRVVVPQRQVQQQRVVHHRQVQQQRHVVQPQRQVQQRHVVRHQTKRVNHHHNHQQALQAQRAKRQAMYAAQAKRKALMLAQQRKRAAMLEQQKRRKIQLAQQQARAAHQAAMLAAKQKRAALLIQQKRRAQQLAQQRRQQAQKRAALIAQQKQRAMAQRHAHNGANAPCPPVRVAKRNPGPAKRVVQQVRRVVQPQVQPRVRFSQQVVTQRSAQNFTPREEVVSRRVITTHVSPTQAPVVVRQAPRVSANQSVFGQSVEQHDYRAARSGWLGSQSVGSQHVGGHQGAVHHEARVRQQRLQQIRMAQIAAQQKHVRQAPAVKMAPIAPYVAPTHVAKSANHSGGWQRNSTVHSHNASNAYAMYQG